MNSHFLVDTFTILDDRNKKTEELVKESDLIILGGGHVPTQNKFFRNPLKEVLKKYEGVIVGVGTGSMNYCKTVYICLNFRRISH